MKTVFPNGHGQKHCDISVIKNPGDANRRDFFKIHMKKYCPTYLPDICSNRLSEKLPPDLRQLFRH